MDSNSLPSGEAVQRRRRGLGLSRTKLAVRVGCSPSMIGLIEDGYAPKRGQVLTRVAEVLDDLESQKAGRS